MKWNQIFNRGKRVAQAEATGSLHSLLLPSLLGISVCLLTLCSLTWAWFTASVSSGVTAIQSANIAVGMYDVTGAESEPTYLEINKEYSVIPDEGLIFFTMNGDAKMAYLEIKVGNATQYTRYLAKEAGDTDETLYGVLLDDAGTEVTVTLKWGPLPNDMTGTEESLLPCQKLPDVALLPAEPVAPDDSDDTVDPVDPVTPVEPANPANPVEPTEPNTEPNTPTEPTTPTEMPETLTTADTSTEVSAETADATPAA